MYAFTFVLSGDTSESIDGDIGVIFSVSWIFHIQICLNKQILIANHHKVIHFINWISHILRSTIIIVDNAPIYYFYWNKILLYIDSYMWAIAMHEHIGNIKNDHRPLALYTTHFAAMTTITTTLSDNAEWFVEREWTSTDFWQPPMHCTQARSEQKAMWIFFKKILSSSDILLYWYYFWFRGKKWLLFSMAEDFFC